MITSKYMPRIVAVVLCFSLLTCGFIVYAANVFDTSRVYEYQGKLFGDEIISLEIKADRDDWQDMLDTAQDKEWISADVIINGESFSTVGVRTKGNSSLSMMSGGDRYSLQFKADKYIKGQTFFGLGTFCINNMTGDATYMKDYISYEIMDYIGVATPLKNYASVTVNGEDYGFCIALERYDKSFLDRVYNTAAGQLYNAKISMGRRGDFEDMWQDIENEMPIRQRGGGMGFGNMQGGEMDRGNMQGGEMDRGNMQGGGFRGGGFGGGSGGGSLVYTDDNISSYSAIFDNAVFSSSSDKDKKRVITALENLSTGTNLEEYIDVDAVLRYFAAHTVVVNLDSYISNMQQNYYLYERDGKITILPWDYNLAFGGFQSGNASSVVNFPIDTPVSGVSMEDRPLLNKLLEVDEYMERYHDYLWQIVEGYFESGLFENTIISLDKKINRYVKNDVTAFSTYEQYEASLPVFIELGRLRAESIRGQLEGTIPSTSSGQSADSSSLVDASSVNLSSLGSMMGGGGMRQGGRQEGQEWQEGQEGQEGQEEQEEQGNRQQEQDGWQGNPGRGPDDRQGNPGRGPDDRQGNPGRGPADRQGGMIGGDMLNIDMDLLRQARQILSEAGGEISDEVKTALLELGLTEEQIEMFSQMQNRFIGRGNMQGGGFPGMDGQEIFPDGFPGMDGQEAFPGGNNAGGGPQDPSTGNAPQGMNRPDWNATNIPTGQNSNSVGYILITAVLLILLTGASVYVARPRKSVI